MKAYSIVHCPSCGSTDFGNIEVFGINTYVRCSCCGRALKMHAAMRHSIKCPKCNSRLIDVEDNVKAKVHITDSKSNWKADFYQKCPTCKSDVGIKKVSIPEHIN